MITTLLVLLPIWSLLDSLAKAQYTASLVAVSSTTLSSGGTAVMNCTATRVGGLVAGNHIMWEKKQGSNQNYIKFAATSAFGIAPTFQGTYILSKIGWDSQNTYVFSVLSIKGFSLHDEGTYRCSYPEQGTSPAVSNEIAIQMVGFALTWIDTAAPSENGVYVFPPGNSNPLKCKAQFYGNSSDGDAKVFSGQIDISNTFSRNRTTYLSGLTPGFSTFVRVVLREGAYVAPPPQPSAIVSPGVTPPPQSAQVTCKAIDGSGAVIDSSSVYVRRQAINVVTAVSAIVDVASMSTDNLANSTRDGGGRQKLSASKSGVIRAAARATVACATVAATIAIGGTKWLHKLNLVPR